MYKLASCRNSWVLPLTLFFSPWALQEGHQPHHMSTSSTIFSKPTSLTKATAHALSPCAFFLSGQPIHMAHIIICTTSHEQAFEATPCGGAGSRRGPSPHGVIELPSNRLKSPVQGAQATPLRSASE